MLLIIGLGNPGPQYSATRHNIGRMVVERLAARQNIFLSLEPQAYQGVGMIGPHQVRLVLPQSWMNQTGVVVDDLLRQLNISLSDLIVVYDDMDLGFGSLRIRTRGGAGGHNGLRSILSYVETDQFSRLKVGIGHPPLGVPTADYVLSPFFASEVSSLECVLDRAVEALEVWILEGPAVAMNRFNAQPKPEKDT